MNHFHLIGVIDLFRGCAVHARGGRRAEYRPVETANGVAIGGDAVALARLYRRQLGLEEIYVADLDAIEGGTPQDALVASIRQLGITIWLDAGITSVAQAQRAHAAGASSVIVGLETLQSFDQLADICSTVGGDRVVFSLDLRGGVPVTAAGTTMSTQSAVEVAASAAGAGVGRLIVLDLERVGMRSGLDVELLGAIRRAVPGLAVFAGGGVRGPSDLLQLADIGCDGALVATALHSGTIDPRARR